MEPSESCCFGSGQKLVVDKVKFVVTHRPNNPSEVVVLGAGPAGLTAAYELGNHGIRSLVLEQSSQGG
mgnify:CR=1 FL=1